MPKIKLANKNNETVEIDINKSVVIIGSNGAGKTRFGSKIEQNNPVSKRISAQRYLRLNEVVQRKDYETATNELRQHYKNKNPIEPQNDYEQVLVSLFAEEAIRNEEAVKEIKNRETYNKSDLKKSVKEGVIEVWNSVFPYITLHLERDRVKAIPTTGGIEYSGTQMSDGEKVALYLISQVMLAEKNSVLVIDEPELHLHKALMVRLWNELEKQRNDCVFVYITHDLDFAADKPSDKMIWIKKYDNSNGENWEYDFLEYENNLPQDLYLEILGSRKPVLLVEGERGSLDIKVCQLFYKDLTIIPCGTCGEVIRNVKSLEKNADRLNKNYFGLIDKDFRTQDELDKLLKNKIHSISVSEIENLFVLPEVIDMVCEKLSKSDKAEEIKNKIITLYKQDEDNHNFKSKKYKIISHLNNSFGAMENNDDYTKTKEVIFDEIEEKLKEISIVDNNNLVSILSEYPMKGIVGKVQDILDLKGSEYVNLVLGFFVDEQYQKRVTDIFSSYLPNVSNFSN